ncbi:MAG: DUF2330 domain-containing protein [Pirellulales bacterium]|nr:DUF2330 domain-containing protein [Pirellulales bacterium]
MRVYRFTHTAAAAALLAALATSTFADPCGMVPPVFNGPGVPITRIGEQQTYVFYKDGVETFVIRPGFQGKVDEFGMLIPFPTPPAIRKVPDHIFPHVAAAVDPPEVVIDLRPQPKFLAGRGAASPVAESADKLEFRRKRDEVKVLKREAVGMYEVAVLAAGSAKALKKWMDEQGFKYPDGMDKVCNEYIDEDWCFVAVKTKVGQKKGVDPRPGQRRVESKLPQGSTFDGFVQAMGFRFKTDKMVVPMRLSAFNEGELRNIVYLLTDGPRKIRSIPEEYVMRQLTGKQLARNVLDPLPLRIIGGTEKDLKEWHMRGLAERRNPVPKNGAAKELFASDLLAVASGKLSLPHEEQEKQLLAVGERLGLRGGDIDKLNADVLKKEAAKTTAAGIKDLGDMTLTVVDGDFPREVLGSQNLTFAEYKMPSRRNSAEHYDAKIKRAGGPKAGILKLGHFELPKETEMLAHETRQSRMIWSILAAGVGLGLVLVRKARGSAALVLAIAVAMAASKSYAASIDDLVKQLGDTKSAEDAVAELIKTAKTSGGERETVIAALAEVATEDESNVRRGWALVALGDIGGTDVDELLIKIHNDDSQSMLVRTWAAAARVAMTKSTDGLVEKAALISRFPALGRPIGMRIVEAMSKDGESASPEALIKIRNKMPGQIQQALGPAIMGLGAEKLASVLTSGSDMKVRQAAAGYLGALFNSGDKGVPAAVIKTYKFDPEAKEVAWKGGPLYVPGIRWDKENATELIDNLIRWHLFCDLHGKDSEKQQIHNNLFSTSLFPVVGLERPNWQGKDTIRWLQAWAKVVGKDKMKELLKEQKADDNDKYKKIVS